MTVRLTDRFDEKFARLPEEIKRKVNKALDFLDADFRHPGLRTHPVRSHPGIFEAYVDDKYRMTFERRGDVFVMRNVDNHDECLRNP